MNADALICSHPRSGGRWLRFLVAHYLAARHQPDFDVSPATVFGVVPDHAHEPTRGYPAYRFRGRRGFPLLAVCHQPYSADLHRNFPTLLLARNPYDVVVSAYHHLTREKGLTVGSIREFIAHPRLGLGSWIDYMNSWAPTLLRHRDAAFVAYGQLDRDPAGALRAVLTFINEEPDSRAVAAAVESAQALRDSRRIRTGQEGNFWDHLQPEEIFLIQEMTREGLSEFSTWLLASIGVELDPFPRTDL
jgi:hypothetical protein